MPSILPSWLKYLLCCMNINKKRIHTDFPLCRPKNFHPIFPFFRFPLCFFKLELSFAIFIGFHNHINSSYFDNSNYDWLGAQVFLIHPLFYPREVYYYDSLDLFCSNKSFHLCFGSGLSTPQGPGSISPSCSLLHLQSIPLALQTCSSVSHIENSPSKGYYCGWWLPAGMIIGTRKLTLELSNHRGLFS